MISLSTIGSANSQGKVFVPGIYFTYMANRNSGTTVINSLQAVKPGTILVLTIAQADDQATSANATVSSSPTLTWTKQVDAGATSSGNAEIYTTTFTAGGNIDVTSTWGTNGISAVLYAIQNSETTLSGASNSATLQAAPSVAVTTTRINSVLFCVTSDWSAIDGANRVYRDSIKETFYEFRSTIYTGYHYYKITSGIASYTEGLSSPSTMAAGTCVYEVRITKNG